MNASSLRKRLRYRLDAEYRAQRIQASLAKTAKLIAEDADYARLVNLHKKIYNLKQRIELHRNEADRHAKLAASLDADLLGLVGEREEIKKRRKIRKENLISVDKYAISG